MYAQGGYGQAPQQQYNAGYQQQQQYAPQQQQQQYAQQQMTEQPQQAQRTQQQQQEVVTQQAAAPTDQGKPQPIYVDTQHDDMVHDAQLDYYGTKLATSSSGE